MRIELDAKDDEEVTICWGELRIRLFKEFFTPAVKIERRDSNPIQFRTDGELSLPCQSGVNTMTFSLRKQGIIIT